MSVEVLKEYLKENPDDIIKILELTDFHSISFFNNRNEIRCAYYEGGNPTSVSINCNNLQCYVYSKGLGGDLFYLIGIHNNWSFIQTVGFVAKVLNIKDFKNIKIPYIFDGFYKKISHKKYIYSSVVD